MGGAGQADCHLRAGVQAADRRCAGSAQMQAKLRAWDPVAEGKFKEIHPDLECVQDLYECARDAVLVLILTEWDEVKKLDLEKLKEVMATPAIVDGRNIFDPEKVRALGFTYHSVGRH